MRNLFVLVLACVLCVACGKPRTMEYVYVKQNVNDAEARRVRRILEGTDGVLKVIPRHSSQDELTIILHLDDDDEEPGMIQAEELGFTRIRE